jgi:hypothetical protein
MIDYWQGTNDEALPDAAKMMLGKDYIYGKNFAPHDIETRDVSSGKSRKEAAEKLGIKFETIPKLTVDDGIHAAKLAWGHLWIDSEKCHLFLDAIPQYRREWNDKRGMFNERPYHDWTSHPADQFRYACLSESDMVLEKVIQYKQPIYEPMSPYEGSDVKLEWKDRPITMEELSKM